MAISGRIVDAHFFSLPSQGNVYTLLRLGMVNGTNKLLVASLRRKVYSLEFNYGHQGVLIPITKEIQFTYIPGGAEIISIDAFNKCPSSNDCVIGITIIKSGDNTTQYLNIYSELEPGSEIQLDGLAQSCHSLELDFIPYQLYHTEVNWGDGSTPMKEVVWLLSGSDHQVHMYREDKTKHCYSEHQVMEYFPEFEETPSIVLWMDICHCNNSKRRVTAVGCECGYVRVTVVDVTLKVMTASWSVQHDGPVTSVRLFTIPTSLTCSAYLQPVHRDSTEETVDSGSPEVQEVNLLVTNSLEPSVVFRNVLQDGLDYIMPLPDSARYDCVLCSWVDDVDMDGINELLLGTYGQEMLVYKYQPSSSASGNRPAWQLLWQHSFSFPLLALNYVDILGDGLCEFVVLTTKGLQVLQYDLEEVSKLCMQRLKLLTTCITSGSSFKMLQTQDSVGRK